MQSVRRAELHSAELEATVHPSVESETAEIMSAGDAQAIALCSVLAAGSPESASRTGISPGMTGF